MTTITQTLIDKFNGIEPEKTNVNIKLILAACFKLGVFKIEFTKVDGEQSTMLVTLKEDLIPKVENVKPENADIMRVFSTDRNGWRSFKIANLISMVPIQ